MKFARDESLRPKQKVPKDKSGKTFTSTDNLFSFNIKSNSGKKPGVFKRRKKTFTKPKPFKGQKGKK